MINQFVGWLVSAWPILVLINSSLHICRWPIILEVFMALVFYRSFAEKVTYWSGAFSVGN